MAREGVSGAMNLSPECNTSVSFEVTTKAVLLTAANMIDGDRIEVVELLWGDNARCEGAVIEEPVYCNCRQSMHKESSTGVPSVTTISNKLLIDVPGKYYLQYDGENEMGVSVFSRTIQAAPADAQSLRTPCCDCAGTDT